MKNVLMSFAVAVITIGGIQAQESKTVKAESTLKSEVKSDTDASVNQVKRSETKTVKSATDSTAPAIKDSNTGMDIVPTKPAIAPKKQQPTVSKSPKAEITQDQKQANVQSETAEKKVQQSPNPNMASKPKKD